MALIKSCLAGSTDIIPEGKSLVVKNTSSGVVSEIVNNGTTISGVNALLNLTMNAKGVNTISCVSPSGINILALIGVNSSGSTVLATSTVTNVDVSAYDYIVLDCHATGAVGDFTFTLT